MTILNLFFLTTSAFLVGLSTILWVKLVKKKELEVLLIQSEARFRALSELPSEGIAIVKNKQIIEMNKKFTEIFGYSEEECKTIGIELLIGEETKKNASSRLTISVFTTMFSISIETKSKAKNGMPLFLEIHSIPSKFLNEPVKIISIKDITEKKKSEMLILEQGVKLAAASKMVTLGEMAGGIAHEINNPLAIIGITSDAIEGMLDRESIDIVKLKSQLEKIKKTTNKIAKIVSGLRFFARDVSKDPFISCSINNIINETVALCREKFKNNNIQLIINQTQHDLDFEGRPSEISQVILNLLSNSYDALENKADKWVKIETKDLFNRIEMSITDSGSGIPIETVEKVLQPFFTTKEIGKGTGLGLSISKGIIDAHYGALYVDTNCKNTRFVIHIPKKRL